ncbi:hypothetical protein [Kineococcus sp. G2]|uniref:hypothetical protein n=1 Tax=Kineococcus sp. G2 TaxID=3127484 RepID=UPI00301BAE07
MSSNGGAGSSGGSSGGGSGPAGGSGSSDSRWTRATTVMTCLAALFGLGTAGLGLFANQVSDDRNEVQVAATDLRGQVDALSQNVKDLGAERDGLQAQLGAAEDRIDQLNNALAAAGAKPPTQTDGDQVVVRREGQLAFVSGVTDWTDLDDARDPQWGRNSDSVGNEKGDLQNYAPDETSRLQIGRNAKIAPQGYTEQATYEQCRTNTTYVTGFVSITSAEVGRVYCFYTSEGRYASGVITEMNSSRLVFDMRVYEPTS